jgi:uncharacterized membrane protein YhaH (DUF805 family)
VWLFARFDGRIGREVYWLSNFAVAAILALFIRPAVDPETDQLTIVFSPLGAVAFVFAVFSSFAIYAKRLHDLGLSALLSGLLLAPMALQVVPIASQIATIVIGAMTVVIGFLPGTRGPNRYGAAADRPPR